MKKVNQDEILVRKAKQIVSDFADFTEGLNLILLIHRAKEGAERANNDKVKKVIVKDRKEYEETVYNLLVKTQESGLPYRIYASCAPRDVTKAIRKFKQEQLDADYFGEAEKHGFYTDIFNRFFGCLATPSSSAETRFLIDLDSREEEADCLKQIGNAGLNDHVLKRYYTKNGMHVVMRPFNPELLGPFAANIHKDGLILLNY